MVAGRVAVVTTSSRLPGLLGGRAWQVLHDADQVHVVADGGPGAAAVDLPGRRPVPLPGTPAEVAAELLRAAEGGRAVALVVDADEPLWVEALQAAARPASAAGDTAAATVEVVAAASEPVGARLLDAVAVMHRLRSPGGCPWDAEQTHASLARYLLEEAYEAVDAVERGRLVELRDELGDVLLQVLFHSRVASERAADDDGWDVDDVASGLVAKLVRRHPHVFPAADGTTTRADDASAVQATWDELKAAEGRTSVLQGVAAGQPALSLAAKLQSRAEKAGLPADLSSPVLAGAESPAAAVAGAAAGLRDEAPSVDRVGDLLLAVVALARSHDVDPEAALRGAAGRFRDRVLAVEQAAGAAAGQPLRLEAQAWRDGWDAGR